MATNNMQDVIIQVTNIDRWPKTEWSYKLSVTDDMDECIQTKVGVNDDKNDTYKQTKVL